jgi:hypothetical protein
MCVFLLIIYNNIEFIQIFKIGGINYANILCQLYVYISSMSNNNAQPRITGWGSNALYGPFAYGPNQYKSSVWDETSGGLSGESGWNNSGFSNGVTANAWSGNCGCNPTYRTTCNCGYTHKHKHSRHHHHSHHRSSDRCDRTSRSRSRSRSSAITDRTGSMVQF